MKKALLKLIKIFFPNEAVFIQGRVRAIGVDKFTGEMVADTGWSKNLIMLATNTGKGLILQKLGGNNTYTANILYMDIGTGTTTPAASDTQLTAAVARVGSPAASVTSNVLSMQFFFPDSSLANTTYNEVGTFVDGSAAVNTGQIFNHALFATPYVKTAGVDTTLQVDFTIN